MPLMCHRKVLAMMMDIPLGKVYLCGVFSKQLQLINICAIRQPDHIIPVMVQMPHGRAESDLSTGMAVKFAMAWGSFGNVIRTAPVKFANPDI